MRQKGSAVVYILLAVFFVAAIFVAYYFGKGGFSLKLEKDNVTPTEVITTLPPSGTTVATTPEATATPNSSIPSGWSTYKNDKYGFQISYPANYKALTDSNNLYGWPKAVVLIYSGGQSYDLPIEVWNNQAEYEAKYKNQNNLVVKEVNGKFITLVNANFLNEVDEIIATFKELQ